MAALTERYRVLRYDNRGHGASGAPEGPYTLDRIATDARELIAALELDSVLWCGLSLGGMVGMWLAAHAPHCIKRAVLANTSPRIGPPDIWNQRIALLEREGMDALARVVIQRWLTPGYIEEHPSVAAKLTAMIAGIPPQGYAGGAAAVRDMDLRDSISRISVPVLVIAGTADPATPPAMSEQIVAAVHGSRFALLEAAHLSNIERADEFNRLVLNFFNAASEHGHG